VKIMEGWQQDGRDGGKRGLAISFIFPLVLIEKLCVMISTSTSTSDTALMGQILFLSPVQQCQGNEGDFQALAEPRKSPTGLTCHWT